MGYGNIFLIYQDAVSVAYTNYLGKPSSRHDDMAKELGTAILRLCMDEIHEKVITPAGEQSYREVHSLDMFRCANAVNQVAREHSTGFNVLIWSGNRLCHARDAKQSELESAIRHLQMLIDRESQTNQGPNKKECSKPRDCAPAPCSAAVVPDEPL